jgi:hypothetical protein
MGTCEIVAEAYLWPTRLQERAETLSRSGGR